MGEERSNITLGFVHRWTFPDKLKERMRQFELALHPDKTRLIRFGRHAAKQRAKLRGGSPKPSTSSISRICTRSREWGSFVVGRKRIKKRTANQAAGHQDRVAQDNARPHRVGPVAPLRLRHEARRLQQDRHAAVKKGSDLCIHEYTRRNRSRRSRCGAITASAANKRTL
jgi:hypothetical protein